MNFLFNNRPFSIASKLLLGCFVVLVYGLIQGHSAFAGTCTFASTEPTNNWHIAANWGCGGVPTSTSPVVIPAATTTYILADTAATAGSVTITGTLKPWGATLGVNGDWTKTGTFVAGTSTVSFTGSADQTINSTTTFNNLAVVFKFTGSVIAAAPITVNGTFDTLVAGTFNAAAYDLSVTGATTIGADTMVTSTSGDLTFASTTNNGELGTLNGLIVITATTTNNGVLSIGNAGALIQDLHNNGIINGNGGIINLYGNWDLPGTFNPQRGAVYFLGVANQNMPALTYNSTYIDVGGTLTMVGSATTTNLTVAGGTLAVTDKILYVPGTYANASLVTRTTGKIKHAANYENFVNSSGVTQTSYTTPGAIYLEVKDTNRNMNGAVAETITVPITVNAAGGSDTETITLTETGPATGIFRSGLVGLYTGASVVPGNGEIVISASGVGTETYTDNQDASDTGATTATLTYAGVVNPPGGGGGGGGGGGLPPVVTHYESGTSGADRTANLANLSSMGLPVNSLVKLPDDGNGVTQEDSAVYYIGSDGKRHAFPNSKIYFTWYSSFDNVKIITLSQLASIPLGSNVRYKPGSRMIKFTTDLKVYAIDAKGTLRWVKTEDLAKALYGNDWNTKIDDLSDAFFGNYSFGTDVNSGADFDVNKITASVQSISDEL